MKDSVDQAFDQQSGGGEEEGAERRGSLDHCRVLSVLMALGTMVLMKVENSQEKEYIFPLKCSGERELNNQSLLLPLSSNSIKSVEIS